MAFELEVEAAKRVAQEAGALALDYARRGVTAETKSDESPVTAADRACEKLIVEVLSREFPDDGILGEEGANRDSRSGRKWIIDPIDGTKDFVRGIPLWAVLIGLEDNGRIVVGAGLGSQAHEEFAAFGEDPEPRVRAERLDEGLDILVGLLSGEPFAYRGRHYSVAETIFRPRALQVPRPPI
jgi:fructose-1,6-bisphosphatase/inositol monophosphatase family enzyme